MSTPMARRQLGSLEVSAVGLGCMGMSDFYGPVDDRVSLGVLNHAIDIGVNFLDTADVYGTGAKVRHLGLSEASGATVQSVRQIATSRGCTPAQLALAWLLHRGPSIVPIPGTRSVTRLDENAAAAAIHLSDAEVRMIADVLAERTVAGARYHAADMATVNV